MHIKMSNTSAAVCFYPSSIFQQTPSIRRTNKFEEIQRNMSWLPPEYGWFLWIQFSLMIKI